MNSRIKPLEFAPFPAWWWSQILVVVSPFQLISECPATDWRPPGLCVEAQQTRWPQATLNDLSLLHAGNINIICYIYIYTYIVYTWESWYIYIYSIYTHILYIHENHDIYILYIYTYIFNVMYTLCFGLCPIHSHNLSRFLEPCTGGWMVLLSRSLERWLARGILHPNRYLI